jgi:ribosomal subunit interface protein
MKINIKAANLDLTPALNQYLEEKIDSLSKFLKNYEIEGEIQARVEVGRTSRHHHRGNVFRAEVNLILPKKILRSVAEREDIRVAIDEVKDELQQEIKKYKGLSQNLRAERR